MAVQTRNAASASHRRLTRSSPSHVKEAQFIQSQARAIAFGKRLGNKELASLKITRPKPLDGSLKGVSSSRTRSRYSLRIGDKGRVVVRKATKKKSKKGKSIEEVYSGPGYLAEATKAVFPIYQECAICAESKEAHEYPTGKISDSCAHNPGACRLCIAKHARTELEKGIPWPKMSCVECTVLVGRVKISNSVWKEDFESLEEIAKRKTEERHARYRWCPAPNCSSGQIHWSYKSPIVKCKNCGTKSCFHHRSLWHEGYSCQGYDDSHPEAVSARSSEERVKSMAKKCPGKGCDHYVQKDGGCDHIYCSKCYSRWNWTQVKYEVARTTYTAEFPVRKNDGLVSA